MDGSASLLFLNGGKCSLANLKEFLKDYQTTSGQAINLHKSSFFTSSKLPVSRVRAIEQYLGISKATSHLLYLGVPMVVGRNKTSYFQLLLDKIESGISGWRARVLSQADFLWGWADGKKRLHWRNWKLVASTKQEGRLGVRKLSESMEAFCIKMAWSIRFNDRHNLWDVFMASKYRQDLAVTPSPWLSPAPSPMWKKICQDFLGALGPLVPSAVLLLLPQDVINHIFHQGFCIAEGPEIPVWPFTPSGNFMVSLAWTASRISRERKGWANWVWHTKMPPRISIFLWKVLNGAIPVDAAVQNRGVHLMSRCECCSSDSSSGSAIETIHRLFLEGDMAKVAWL
ncbi:uncharacterized protein LOC131254349 [Magnolia sinica]|uniref:uncharacterized protein LOC131254349 n=1 Tax=Magnolia sinica TaxID=86752 RepID=UPI00265B4C82|nr:uncharacterized protein LOC131254349 [Magnolia sinica]